MIQYQNINNFSKGKQKQNFSKPREKSIAMNFLGWTNSLNYLPPKVVDPESDMLTYVTQQSLDSSGLSWPGSTAEQLAFLRSVYDINLARKAGRTFVNDVPENQLATIEGRFKLRSQAAQSAIQMLQAARAAIISSGENVEIGLTSAYRSASHQFRLWNDYVQNQYYPITKSHRQGLDGGEYGEAAAKYLAQYTRVRIATPGYSNHNDGLALDIKNTEDGQLFRNKTKTSFTDAWTTTWLWDWLTANAATYHFYQNTQINEPWHWVYQPLSSGSSITLTTTCRSFVPSQIDKIVLNQTLLNPPLGNTSDPTVLPFRNWGARRGTTGSGNGVLHFTNTGRTSGCRAVSDIQTIVLHETGRNNASGHSMPGIVNRNLGVHFLIEQDGKIVQFNDIVDTLPHGSSGWNNTTVGIEFANAHFHGATGDQLNLNWESSNYQVPSLDALESCYNLVNWLTINLPNVKASYLSLMQIPSGVHRNKACWHVHYHPRATAPSLHTPKSGIISHNVYNKQKPDGWFLALYCWCRSSAGQNLASQDALNRAKSIAQAGRDKIVKIDGNIFILI